MSLVIVRQSVRRCGHAHSLFVSVSVSMCLFVHVFARAHSMNDRVSLMYAEMCTCMTHACIGRRTGVLACAHTLAAAVRLASRPAGADMSLWAQVGPGAKPGV